MGDWPNLKQSRSFSTFITAIASDELNQRLDCPAHIKVKLGDKDTIKHTLECLSEGLKGESLEELLEDLRAKVLFNRISVKTVIIKISSQYDKRSCH